MKRLLAPALVGLIAGLDNLGAGIAFAALLFPAGLSAGLGMGVGVMLLSGAITALVIALRSGHANSIALVQETGIAILAAAMAGLLAGRAALPEPVRIATVFAILGCSTLATGVLFWLCGRLRLGTLVRFLPYPVVAGFLAGSGWLLVEGALMMLTGRHDAAGMLAGIGDRLVLAQLLPALAFAGLMLLMVRRAAHPLATTGLLLGAGLAFHLLLGVLDISPDQARSWNWLPTVPGDGRVDLPSPLWIAGTADWDTVLRATPAMLSAALLALLGLLLNVGGLEAACGREVDANRELRAGGAANLLSGALGGAAGFLGLGMTLLADRFGAKGRGAGVATALVLGVGLLWAPTLAALMPTFLAAGLMLFLGFELLHDWAFDSRRRLPRGEWLAVIAILLAIMLTGFLAGLTLGLVIAVATFVYAYARLPVVRLVSSGRDRRSSVDRSAAAGQYLDRHGAQVAVLELQGYLFFGTAEQLVARVRQRLAEAPALRVLILDVGAVSGLDSAAVAGFCKVAAMVARDRAALCLCGVGPALDDRLRHGGFPLDGVMVLPDLDHALERAEEMLLADVPWAGATGSARDYLEQVLGPQPRLDDLVAAMARRELDPGDALIRAGDAADDVYLVESGRVQVRLPLPGGQTLRLRSMAAGTVVGEIALYLGGPRTADVVVEAAATVYRLDRETLTRLEQEDTDLALLAHRLLAITLAERLTLANRLLQATLG